MPQIYRITNLLNSKIYVGKSLYPSDEYFGSGIIITNAIKKYGKSNFVKDILEECNKDVLDEREIYWIDKLQSTNMSIGYNISAGGQGGNHYWKTLTDEGKIAHNNKISIAKTGQTINYTDTHRENVKESLADFWKNKKNDTTWIKSRIRSKKYVISDGIEFIRINNLKEYCEINKLGEPTLCSIATGKRINPYKNKWYCFYDSLSDEDVLIKIAELKLQQIANYEEFINKCKNRPKQKCPHCGAVVVTSAFNKWHNDNCKKKIK